MKRKVLASFVSAAALSFTSLGVSAEGLTKKSADFEIIKSFGNGTGSKKNFEYEKNSVYIFSAVDPSHWYYGITSEYPDCYGKGTLVRLNNKDMEMELRELAAAYGWRSKDEPITDEYVVSPHEGWFAFFNNDGETEESFTVLYPGMILRTGYEDVPEDNPAWKIFEQLNDYLDELDADIAAKLPAGDITADNKVNATDIAVLAAHIKGVRALYEVDNVVITQTKRADINKDGKTDVSDLAKLAAYIKGKSVL